MLRRRRLLRFAAAVSAFLLLLCSTSLLQSLLISTQSGLLSSQSWLTDSQPWDPKTDSHLVYARGCKIPYMYPWDRSVKHLLWAGATVKCTGSPALTYIDGQWLRINKTSLERYYNNSLSRCSYESITRTGDGYTDDKFKFKMERRHFETDIVLENDFIRVVCYGVDGRMIYANFHALVIERPHLEKFRERRYLNHVKYRKPKAKMNVIMVGLDSMSRMNFMRQMPRTYQYLLEELGAYDMSGYNKVADNTYVNVVPMLTGKFVEELPWNENMIQEPFDKYDFAWKNFAKQGYRTMFAEDFPEIAIFNYHKVGFFRQPTDYYLRPYSLAMDSHGSLWNQEYHCIGDKLETDHVLDYTADFARKFKEKEYFSFSFITRLTHEDTNRAGAADLPHLNFLKNLNQNGTLANSVIIYFSDHGTRFGKFRETYQGRLEERLPVMMVSLPKWFEETYPELARNLEINTRRLTTPFDIHSLLMDILDFQPKKILSRAVSAQNRSISWFNEIPQDRDCQNAQILSHWCTCHEWDDVDLNSIQVVKVAEALVNFINNDIQNHNLTEYCSALTLERVTQASRLKPSDELLHFKESYRDVINRKVTYGDRATSTYVQYILTIETNPGNALFEATVRYSETDKRYSIVGDISRINRYGHQSDCVDNFNMKKFCYCRS